MSTNHRLYVTVAPSDQISEQPSRVDGHDDSSSTASDDNQRATASSDAGQEEICALQSCIQQNTALFSEGRTSEEWVEWAQGALGVDWENHLKEAKKHKEAMEKLEFEEAGRKAELDDQKRLKALREVLDKNKRKWQEEEAVVRCQLDRLSAEIEEVRNSTESSTASDSAFIW